MKVIGFPGLLMLASLWLVSPFVTAQAQEVRVSVVIDKPMEHCWERLSDFSAAPRYVPNLPRVEIMSSQHSGLGAHRRAYNNDGDFIEETIIDWQEGSGFVLKLHKGESPTTPFERAEFIYQLSAVDEESSRMTLSMVTEMPMGAVGAKLGEWFIQPKMQDTLIKVAAGLKHYYETGQPATDEDRERLAGEVQLVPASATALE